ncbi:MAG: hypothetical protein ACYS0G_04250 [Planctomycetota bacterium]|jgi:hypothetical protein
MMPSSSHDATNTAESLRALLSGVVDYAGLFPPARLDMPATVERYAEYLGCEHAWMLGRLVIPIDRLDELERHAAGLLDTREDGEAWQIGGLVAAAGDPRLEADLERIAAFNERHAKPEAGLAAIPVIELRARTPAEIDDALNRMPDELFPFFELPVDRDPRGLVAALAGSAAGAKVRTGGPTPEGYPTPSRLARFIATCAAAPAPFKATAGLHHPLPHDAGGTKEFGFLNVLVAAGLAFKRKRPERDLVRVLTDESLEAFAFGGGDLRYRDDELTIDQIEETRLDFAVSFGACSFEEPRDDLRALKLL